MTKIERLNGRGEVLAILDLSHPLLVPFEASGHVFVVAECGECCGWQPRLICELKKGEDAYNLAGELVVSMATDFAA